MQVHLLQLLLHNYHHNNPKKKTATSPWHLAFATVNHQESIFDFARLCYVCNLIQCLIWPSLANSCFCWLPSLKSCRRNRCFPHCLQSFPRHSVHSCCHHAMQIEAIWVSRWTRTLQMRLRWPFGAWPWRKPMCKRQEMQSGSLVSRRGFQSPVCLDSFQNSPVSLV